MQLRQLIISLKMTFITIYICMQLTYVYTFLFIDNNKDPQRSSKILKDSQRSSKILKIPQRSAEIKKYPQRS